MKKIIGFSICLLLIIGGLQAQNVFGEVGSYWRYSFEPHSGGSGWTMITIEKDTIINGENFKKYSWKHHVMEGYYPAVEYSNTGLLRIENDTVFHYDSVILDFNMNDSLRLEGLSVEIDLAVDSMTIELIDGVEYKKWHGQKVCVMGANDIGPYEPFTILETVGQIEYDYLFWNIDGCAIGGGTNTFVCYQNGDFSYPPGVECEKLLLSNDDLLEANEIRIFPNPVDNILNVNAVNKSIDNITILSIEGKVVFKGEVNSDIFSLDVSQFDKGVYLVKVAIGSKLAVKKLLVD